MTLMYDKYVLQGCIFSTFTFSLRRFCLCSLLNVDDMRNTQWIRFHLHSYFLVMGGYFDFVAFCASVRSSSRSVIVPWVILMLCSCYFRENMRGVQYEGRNGGPQKSALAPAFIFIVKVPFPCSTKTDVMSYPFIFGIFCHIRG